MFEALEKVFVKDEDLDVALVVQPAEHAQVDATLDEEVDHPEVALEVVLVKEDALALVRSHQAVLLHARVLHEVDLLQTKAFEEHAQVAQAQLDELVLQFVVLRQTFDILCIAKLFSFAQWWSLLPFLHVS